MHAPFIRKGILPGVLAGAAGGVVSGAGLAGVHGLDSLAAAVGSDAAALGFVMYVVIAAVLGAGLGVLAQKQRREAGETLFWGVTYGALWWFVGVLTLAPLLRGDGVDWSVRAAQGALPHLFGQLLYGAGTGLALIVLARLRPDRDTVVGKQVRYTGPVVRGLLGGVLAAGIVGVLLDAQDRLGQFSGDMGSGWPPALALGLMAGAGYAALYPRPAGSPGASLIRGMVYGFLWWAFGAMTVLPMLAGGDPAWTLAATRDSFGGLLAWLLFGGFMALAYRFLTGAWRLLFSSELVEPEPEGAGAQGVRAILRGTLAGLIGGLLFTAIMVQIGFLPTVASLVGGDSRFLGLVVHLLISFAIGTCYAVLFRGQSFDAGSALGWGVSYGFFWWVLGPLTLLPLLLGDAPVWTVDAAAGLTASLVGHLAYGAGLGITFHTLEARYSPWWIPFEHTDAERLARRREQLQTSAPALWALVTVIALTLPVVVGM